MILRTATKTAGPTGLNFCFSAVFFSPEFWALGRALQLVQFCPPQLGPFHCGHMRFRLDTSSPSYPCIYVQKKPQIFAVISR